FEAVDIGIEQRIAPLVAVVAGNLAAPPQVVEVDMIAAVLLDAVQRQHRRLERQCQSERPHRKLGRVTEEILAQRLRRSADGDAVGGNGDKPASADSLVEAYRRGDVE